MIDIFESKIVKPMLIGKTGDAFDSPDFIYELKFDGERCVAFLDPQKGTDLRNKRGVSMLTKVPELSGIHQHIMTRCVLDGELIVMVDGAPNFFEIQRRSLTTNANKIHIQSKLHPATFVAYDILYYADHTVMSLPLMQRKSILSSAVKDENESFAISRYIENDGVTFFDLTVEKELEGIVAKQKNSLYYPGKETKEWIKIKNLQDDDFVICGYSSTSNGMVSVVLAQYQADRLAYKGQVLMSVSSDDYALIGCAKPIASPPLLVYPTEVSLVKWIEPQYVCTVKYMMKTASGSMRQPVFKGIRFDKAPKECVVR